MTHFVSSSCEGERCSICGASATHKVGEENSWDDPQSVRHNLTAYICCKHFRLIMGREATGKCGGKPRVMPEPKEIFTVRAIDNYDGEWDEYLALAFLDDDGVLRSSESDAPLLTHTGDAVLEWWSLRHDTGSPFADDVGWHNSNERQYESGADRQ